MMPGLLEAPALFMASEFPRIVFRGCLIIPTYEPIASP